MTSDNRHADRNELDSMTREFLARGGKIVQCPPGSSDSVVYKRTSFRRRGAPAADAKTDAAETPAASAASSPDSLTPDASVPAASVPAAPIKE